LQPEDRDTTLQWRIYPPSNGAPSPWPGVITIHGGKWRSGDPFQTDVSRAAHDIAAHGYYVVDIDYELAPCGLIVNQICHGSADDINGQSGRPPEQTDDVKAAVKALRWTHIATAESVWWEDQPEARTLSGLPSTRPVPPPGPIGIKLVMIEQIVLSVFQEHTNTMTEHQKVTR
jgi:hypothetical protein